MQEFNPGDLVRVKSGGPLMTVARYREDLGKYECTWMDAKEVPCTGYFYASVLEKVEDI